MAVSSGGKTGGKGGKGKAPAGKGKSKPKPSKPKYEAIKPGRTHPVKMNAPTPKAVKSPNDHSSNKGHAFGYFRMGIDPR